MACFYISMLGEFSISYNGNALCDQNNRSKKTWNLLGYLINYRDREISQEDLIQLLWGDDAGNNPAGSLKVLLHRIRKSLEVLKYEGPEKIIEQYQGAYAWNRKLECVIDTQCFEQLCKKAAMPDLPVSKRIDYYLEALALFRGDFLPNISSEPWVIPISVYFHSLYLKSVHETANLLESEGRFAEVETICLQALKLEQFDETLYYRLINALYRSGKQQEARQRYNLVTDLFFTKLGITPSNEMKQLYREIMKTSNCLEMDLNTIKEHLREKDSTEGAFYCEYEFFKEIYQLEVRACARTGYSIYLALLTLSTIRGNLPNQNFLNKAMDELKRCTQESLRKGDVFSRFSLSQYIIMLPSTSLENGKMVVERILKVFYKKYTGTQVMIQYNLQPIETPESE